MKVDRRVSQKPEKEIIMVSGTIAVEMRHGGIQDRFWRQSCRTCQGIGWEGEGDDDFNWVAEKWSGTEWKWNKNFTLARLNLIKYPWVDSVGLKKKSGVEREKHFVTTNL